MTSKEAEKMILKDYKDGSEMSKKELSKTISSIRDQYESDKEDILRDKMKDIKKLEKEHERKMTKFAQSYELDPYIKIVLNSAKTGYEAIERE